MQSEEEFFLKSNKTEMPRGININSWDLPALKEEEMPFSKGHKIRVDRESSGVMTDWLNNTSLRTVLTKNEYTWKDNGADGLVYNEHLFQTTDQLKSHSASKVEKTKLYAAMLPRIWDVPADLGDDKQQNSPDIEIDRAAIRGYISTPCSVRKRTFMVYICGGYQGMTSRKWL